MRLSVAILVPKVTHLSTCTFTYLTKSATWRKNCNYKVSTYRSLLNAPQVSENYCFFAVSGRPPRTRATKSRFSSSKTRNRSDILGGLGHINSSPPKEVIERRFPSKEIFEMVICSSRTDIGSGARSAAASRGIPLLVCALVLFWSVSAKAQATQKCGEALAIQLESTIGTSVVWGGADEASSQSVVWNGESFDEDSVVWGTSVVWGADGSESSDTMWVDSVVWGVGQDDLACVNVPDGEN
jgi:hypothetical protein